MKLPALRSLLPCLITLFILATGAKLLQAQTTDLPVKLSATFTVTEANDAVDAVPGDGICDADAIAPGDQCTLRAAIMESNLSPSSEQILLPAVTLQLSIPGDQEDSALTGDLDILNAVTIQGIGSAQTSIDGGTLDRIFDIRQDEATTVSVAMIGVTVQNGEATAELPFAGEASCSLIPDCGGGIRLAGQLVMSDVIVLRNGAFRGGGIAVLPGARLAMSSSQSSENFGTFGGGIYSEGDIELHDVTLNSNQSTRGGGLAMLDGAALLENTIILYNAATIGGGLFVAELAGAETAPSLTMRGGSLIGNLGSERGGGVYNRASVNLQQVHFDYNRSAGNGGGIYSTQAQNNVAGNATLQISDSLFEYNEASRGGGILVAGHAFTLTRSTLYKNAATSLECGGIYLLGNPASPAVNVPGTDQNTVGNSSADWVSARHAALSAPSQIVNSTIVSNSGGICTDGLPIELRNITVAYNHNLGIDLRANHDSNLIVRSSIIADNKGGDCRDAAQQNSLPWHDSLVQDPGNCSFGETRILSNVHAMLGNLQNNGGNTPTMAPNAHSPVIDLTDDASLCEATDQRGVPRPQDGNADGAQGCDLGAVEVEAPVLAENRLFLPLVSKPYAAPWRQLGGEGQRLSTLAFEIIPNQGVNLWVGDIRPLLDGGGIYSASLPSDCKGMSALGRVDHQFRVLDLLFDGETAIGATFGNRAIFLDRANDTWLETPSLINKNVYSLVRGDDGAYYAGSDDGVYKSKTGTEWTKIGGPPDINDLELRGHLLWIGTARDGIQLLNVNDNKLLPTNNGGLANAAREIWDILWVNDQPFIATSDGIYQYVEEDDNAVWQAIGLQQTMVNTLEMVGSELFAGTRAAGAWVRPPNSETWVPLAAGVGWNPYATVQELSYQKDFCGGKLFAATDNGVWLLDKD